MLPQAARHWPFFTPQAGAGWLCGSQVAEGGGGAASSLQQ